MPFFTAVFLSFFLKVHIGGSFGQLPLSMLFDSVLINLAYGISGFLMSFVIMLISRSRKNDAVVFSGVTVAIMHVFWWYTFIDPQSLSLFFKIYWLLWILLNVIFLLGFACLGTWFVNEVHRLKVRKAEKNVQ